MQGVKQKIFLSEQEVARLPELLKKYQSDWKVLRRLKAISLRNEGLVTNEIMRLTDASWDSVTARCNLYRAEGLDGLCGMKYDGRRISEFECIKKEILLMIDVKLYGSYAELYDAVCQKFTIKGKIDALYKFCKKNGIGVTKSAI